MPQIKTLDAESVFKADHGGEKFLITAVADDPVAGKTKFKVHTWSPTIAKEGFEGEVEKYRDKGGDDCVRLPKKEEWKTGGSNSGPKTSYSRDDEAIKAQWAIGQAVAWCSAHDLESAAIEPQAKEFFKMIDRVKGGEPTPEAKPSVDTAREVFGGEETVLTGDEPDFDKPVDLADIPF